MLLGWRKFGKEFPKTDYPFAYCNGQRGLLSKKDDQWFFSLGKCTEIKCIPALYSLGILFMDDMRGKK